jgi:HAD superfamily hydrolase (TIGR01450 family)
MSAVRLREAAAAVRAARAVFLDWDGTLMHGARPVPGASELMQAVADRAWILSNNSTDLPEDFRLLARELGVELPPDRFILAGCVTLAEARARWGDRPVHLIASSRMRAHAQALGLRLGTRGVAALVVMRDTAFSYAKLSRAANAGGALEGILVSNPDRVHPGSPTTVTPETGALLAAVRACLPSPPATVVVGKPEPSLFRAALAAAQVRPDQAVMIGDNPETDIAGARACGIPAVLLDRTLDVAGLAAALTTSRQAAVG